MKNATPDVNLLLVIDAKSLHLACPRPSKNAHKPLPLPAGTWYLFGSAVAALQADGDVADVSIVVPPKAGIVFRTISDTGNYRDASLLYNLPSAAGVDSPNPLSLSCETLLGAVQPDPNTATGLPPIYVQEVFAKTRLNLAWMKGPQLALPIALYDLAHNGQEQRLYGYFALQMNLYIASSGK